MSKQSMALPSADEARHVDRNIADLYNTALIEHMVEDDAIPVQKLKLDEGYTVVS